MKTTATIGIGLLLGMAGVQAGVAKPDEFTALAGEIAASKTWNRDRLVREAVRRDALILPADRTPCDVVYRRIGALLAYLRTLPEPPDLNTEAAELATLQPDPT
jgi:hypothetical protein